MKIELPTPSIDMRGAVGAAWLDQIADLYTGTDASHVRAWADQLRREHDAAIKAAISARAEKIKDLEDQLAGVEDDRRQLSDEEDDIEGKLRSARSS